MTTSNHITDPLKFVRPNILALTPYSTARDEYKGGNITAWLDANENPFDNNLNRYPDPRHPELKAMVAALKGVNPDQVFLGGSGSDEVIDIIYRTFCTPARDNVVAIAPTYGVYSVSAQINDVEYRTALLNSDFSLNSDHILALTDQHTKVIWICSPNNPTGNAFPPEQILTLARQFDGIVAVDEAYGDFSPYPSLSNHIDRQPNIIVLQTLSKAWGLAALRVGIALCHNSIASIFGKVKYPYNLAGPIQREIREQLTRNITAEVNTLLSERQRLAQALEQLPCVIKVFPSHSNFLLVRVTDAQGIYDHLIQGGVIVRNRASQPLCENCLRITVGTPEQNTLTIRLLNDYAK